MEDGDDDVPPLEDMSEALSTCLQLREDNLKKQNLPKREVLEVVEDAEQMKVKRIEKLLEKSEATSELEEETDSRRINSTAAGTEKNISTDIKKTDNFCGFKKGFFDSPPKKTSPNSADTNKENVQKKKNDSTGNFGGFKKGFFNSANERNKNDVNTKLPKSKSKQKVCGEEVPIVTKKAEANKNVFPEVQNAMKQQQIPFLKSDKWLTDDLLTRIMSHPKLSKQFTDPRFSEAIQLFSTKPGEVMNMCKNNPELKEFIQDFCSLMGNHFAEMGEREEQETRTSSANTKTSPASTTTTTTATEKQQALHPDDERRIKGLMSDPEISSILANSEVQRLLQVLKEDPDKAQKMLSSADVSLRRNIQKLVDVGILQMAV